jgi:O-acetyl-ADP-ribose deacetylase (regulator of RNase III)
METKLDRHIVVKVGDITQEDVDAIVNAANPSLMGGGGVDGAIHRTGGPDIVAECRQIRKTYPDGLPTGEAAITTAGKLIALHVVHTVGPIYGDNEGNDAALLAACYVNSIAAAARAGSTSIAFPAISTGVYGYPREEAAPIAVKAIREGVRRHPTITEVRLVFFSEDDAKAFLDAARA